MGDSKDQVYQYYKGIQVEFFTFDQNAGISLECILTEMDISTSCRFQDIAV